MNVAVIGVSHQSASAELRELLSFTNSQKIAATTALLDAGVAECVILSTCNRSEIYVASHNLDADIPKVLELYENVSANTIFTHRGLDALTHLFMVTAGLDSIVIGEDQILGQVKEAHLAALELGASKKILNKCFREAITTAKNIKATTKISELPLSIAYIGVKFLKEKLGSLKDKTALLIGAGEMNQLVLKYLTAEKIGTVFIANRSPIQNDDYPAIIIPFADRYAKIPEVDVVISCTASPHVIIESFAAPTGEVYILDLAIPRDIAPIIGEIPGVSLYNIDDLQEIANRNNASRTELSQIAIATIEDDIATLAEWFSHISADATLRALNDMCHVIHSDTMRYLNRKLDLDLKEHKLIDQMLLSSLKRLIREPILKIKQETNPVQQAEYIKLLSELFSIPLE